MDYVTFGKGNQPLVIIPGLGDGLQTVKGMAMPFSITYRKLAERYKIYVFSRINELRQGYTTRDMAADVAEAMETLNLDAAYVMGISQGGMIAQWLAVDFPERVQRLILAVTTGKPSQLARERIENWQKLSQSGNFKHLMLDIAQHSYTQKSYQKWRLLYNVMGIFGRIKDKKSLIELERIENELKLMMLSYKVLKTSKKKNANDLMNEVTGDDLIVIGGDGTINEVINNYHGKEFIYLAYGSGNDLARSIKFNRNIEISKLLDSNKYIEYDVGVVNDRKFCSGFDIGFNADIIKRANGSRLKKYLGKYIYFLEGVIGIIRLKKYKAKILWDAGGIDTDKLYLLNVMIQPYEGGGIKFAPNATGQDNILHVMIMENMTVITFIYNYLCLLLKRHDKLKNIKHIRTHRLIIKTNQKYFQIDGELVNNTEQLELSCISKFYKLKRLEINEKKFK